MKTPATGGFIFPEEDLDAVWRGTGRAAAESGPPSEQVRALLAFEAERAYGYYAQADLLAPLVHPVGRPVLQTIVGNLPLAAR